MSYRFGIRVSSWMLALAVAASLASGPVRAQADSAEKIYDRTLRATVWILTPHGGGRMSTGTGSLIDKGQRLVLTNYHVVGDSEGVYVLFPHFEKNKLVAERSAYRDLLRSNGALQGEVLRRDPKRDLAVLQLNTVPPGAHVLRLAQTSPRPGQAVHSIGNPGSSGALWVYTQGSVRAVYHKKWTGNFGGRAHQVDAEVVETQSPTNPGDSGGPLVNDRGQLIGVTQGYLVGAQLVSLFIDVSEVRNFLRSHRLLPRESTPVVSDSRDTSKPSSQQAAEKPQDETVRAEKRAAFKLSSAKGLENIGKLERAKERYEEIVAEFPQTKAAAEAKVLLDRLNK